MFGNQALHRPAAAMAGCHERALDYIRQAPVIVLSANAGQTGRTAAARARAYAGPPMRMLCERGAKLREVMSFYGCAFQLRALAPSVLHPKRWPVVFHLGRLPPSTLAQIIPAARTQQDTWLRALTVWSEHCEYRCGNAWFQFDWVARAAREVRRGHEGVLETIADLAMAASGTVNVPGFRGNRLGQVAGVPGAVFDTRWTLAQAEAAAERWHRALGRAAAEQRAAHGLGVKFSEAMDYAPFTNAPVVVEGFDFVPLRSCEDLWAEGAAMRHCVGTYSAAVVTGVSRILVIRHSRLMAEKRA
ncbi:PcfJ domain-containing protein [Methylobacterium sp. CCH5-D2]|uniref:PcfJ domain-containing protein n=1 Tax=Methylobacterium sp. CCH5-D2 TaxID=1768765 RepID=UPI00082D350A|nr:PcfJ domain-containing protein [Methylobacterium sp. CCH5-D2]